MALPLHPEYRTLAMMYYIPPLSPIMSTVENNLVNLDLPAEREDFELFDQLDKARLPVGYLANLFSNGDSEPIRRILRTMLAVRTYKRRQSVDQSIDQATLDMLESVGLDRGAGPKPIYRLTTIPTIEDRFVLPPYHREMSIESLNDPFSAKGRDGLRTPHRSGKGVVMHPAVVVAMGYRYPHPTAAGDLDAAVTLWLRGPVEVHMRRFHDAVAALQPRRVGGTAHGDDRPHAAVHPVRRRCRMGRELSARCVHGGVEGGDGTRGRGIRRRTCPTTSSRCCGIWRRRRTARRLGRCAAECGDDDETGSPHRVARQPVPAPAGSNGRPGRRSTAPDDRKATMSLNDFLFGVVPVCRRRPRRRRHGHPLETPPILGQLTLVATPREQAALLGHVLVSLGALADPPRTSGRTDHPPGFRALERRDRCGSTSSRSPGSLSRSGPPVG